MNFTIFNEVISQTRNELLNEFDESVVNGGIINENGENITIGRTQKENINADDLYFNFHNIHPLIISLKKNIL